MTSPPSRNMLSPEKQALSGPVGAVPEALVGNGTKLHRVGMTFVPRWTARGQKEGETDHCKPSRMESHPLLSHSDASQGTEGKAQSTRGGRSEGKGQCASIPGHPSRLFPDLSHSASSLLLYTPSSFLSTDSHFMFLTFYVCSHVIGAWGPYLPWSPTPPYAQFWRCGVYKSKMLN